MRIGLARDRAAVVVAEQARRSRQQHPASTPIEREQVRPRADREARMERRTEVPHLDPRSEPVRLVLPGQTRDAVHDPRDLTPRSPARDAMPVRAVPAQQTLVRGDLEHHVRPEGLPVPLVVGDGGEAGSRLR